MKLLPILGALVVVGLTSSPAFALFCTSGGPSAGIEFEFSTGGRIFRPDSDRAQKEMDMQRLQAIGVNATSVERWNGCIRAFVTDGNGRQGMEFYDPATLQRLQ